MNWISEMFDKSVTKEASTDAQQEFTKKVKASGWVDGVMGIDEPAMAKEADAKMEAEIAIRKEAAYEPFQTTEETLKHDYKRDVEILSDFTLASMIAEVRGHAKQDFMENATEYFEAAKKNVKSDRKAVEKELLEATGMSAQLDWRKSFEQYKKDETPKQADEKELYNAKLKDVNDDLSKGGKPDEYSETDEQHAKTMLGVGREQDQRTDVTAQPGEVHKDAALVRDPDVELKLGSLIRLERSVMAKCGTILPAGSHWTISEVNGYNYKITDDKNSYAIASFDTPKFNKLSSLNTEIENHASKSEILQKVAEISSPWKIITDPTTGQECIARVEENSKNTKESKEQDENLSK